MFTEVHIIVCLPYSQGEPINVAFVVATVEVSLF